MSRPDLSPDDAEIPVTVLIVEPDPEVRETLSRLVRGLGHEVVEAAEGEAAFGLVLRRKFAAVLVALHLPGNSGLELLPRILEQEPHAAIVLLTEVADVKLAAHGLQQGAVDYLVRPVDPADLERALDLALARRRDRIEQEETQAWLKNELVWRGRELRKERGRFERISVATLEALVNALEAKDAYLRGHSTRVADLSALVAAELGLVEERIEAVRTAGRLHDIGKIGIRESVIDKQGALTEEEYEHVKRHVMIGVQILSPLTHLREVIAFVRSHHERIDGGGYPDGLSGSAIPIGGRIIGAIEVYDALTTSRPYQDRMERADAVARMQDLVGTVLDGEVVAALRRVIADDRALVFLEED